MRRTLIAGALSVALMAIAASSASAATITPTSVDFGRVLRGQVRTTTFTVTLQSGERCSSPGPPPPCYPIKQDDSAGGFVTNYNSFSFGDDFTSGTCLQLLYLTAATPSCTISVVFKPDQGGKFTGVVAPNMYDVLTTAQLTGIGLRPRNDFFCRSPRKGGEYKKQYSRWCINRQKK
jgi:hypothetical protein